MSSESWLYLFVSLRSLHILVAALWLGTATLMAVILMPAMGNLAPEVTARLNRGKFLPFIASIAGTTVLSGLLLYWHLTSAFSAAGVTSKAGIVFGIGGALGIVAAIIGGGVVGRSAKRIGEIHEAGDPGARSSETLAEMAGLRKRLVVGGRLVVALLVAAVIIMTFGHYV